jgi:hypothetical protein
MLLARSPWPVGVGDHRRAGDQPVLVIKISGAAVFAAAVLVGVGVLTSRILFYDIAIGLAGAALLAVILSSIRWRRRSSGYS